VYISKCPHRFSILGGGSDINWFLQKEGWGCCLGASLKKFNYVILNKTVSDRGIINYSNREEYISTSTISHPLIRSALIKSKLDQKLEICSYSEVKAGKGLGGSSSFLCAFQASINSFKETIQNKYQIATEAADLEINDMNLPIGSQDHYLCALGGINALRFEKNSLSPEIISIDKTLEDALINYLNKTVLIDTTEVHNSMNILSSQQKNISSFSQIREIRDICHETIKNLTIENLDVNLTDAINQSWEIKSSLKSTTNEEIDNIEKSITDIGVKWCKLLGAGGGGYFLVMPKMEQNDFIKRIEDLKLKAFKVEVDIQGLKSQSF
tara:strand:- start:1408 stop:2382 length:975 start_codon:yes stop_codon:yes gene_type:complete